MMKEAKTIIIVYEVSGVFANLYRALGYNVIVIDMQLDGSDARLMKKIMGKVHGILAFPPCTHLAASGARWWKSKGDTALLEALSCVDLVYRLVGLYNPDFWWMENPVGRLTSYIGKPVFSFHPCEFAGYADDPGEEAYTKKTCLWGKFNIPEYKAVVPKLGSKMHFISPGPERQNLRSLTPMGFARAFVQANSAYQPSQLQLSIPA